MYREDMRSSTPEATQGTPPAPSFPAASGTQFCIERAGAKATITSLAACLRHYERDGVELVESFDLDKTPPNASGITLAPFANRIDGGLWELDGQRMQLDITEVERNNAIHGLLRNTGYSLLKASEHSVVLEATIHPQHGFPFLMRHRVSYELTESGSLRVSQMLINDSASRAPFVLGAHPYLKIGSVPTQELRLEVSANIYLTSNERLIPTDTLPVSGIYDLRQGALTADSQMDTAFTDLEYSEGQGLHSLTAPDGRQVALWHDASVSYIHVFITPTFPGRDLAVAIEPMTGPANAFNSGDGLKWLEPGQSFTMNWGIDSVL